MSAKEKLTPKQRQAITYLLTYPTIEQAAKETGVNPKTISRWLAEPLFQQELHAAESAAIAETSRQLVILSQYALKVLADILTGKPVEDMAQKRMAAVSVLDHLVRLRELATVEARLEALEAQVYGPGR